MELLTLTEMTCGYSNSFMLKEISFSVKKNSITGIIGPNGSGKTTLFKGITGEIKLLNGSLTLNNIALNKLPIKEKARMIAVVTQFTEVADLSVEEYVLMGRIPHRSKWQFFESEKDYHIAEKYMKLTDVYKFRHKSMCQLSGGEQQLVSIARALTQEPCILLLDEPTSHLDITHQVQVLNLLQELTINHGLSVLMIIHDLNLAGEYCDYLVLLDKGRIYKHGKPEKVLNYKTIEEVYKTVVVTRENPLSKKPVVFLVSNKILTSNNKK